MPTQNCSWKGEWQMNRSLFNRNVARIALIAFGSCCVPLVAPQPVRAQYANKQLVYGPLLLALQIADPDPDAGAIRFELERDFIALQGFREPALTGQVASEAGKIFGVALVDADRAHRKIDREIDLVRLRVKPAGQIERARVLRVQCQSPLYPFFSDGEQSGLKMPQAGIVQRCGGVFRRMTYLAGGTELFALHNLVQVK